MVCCAVGAAITAALVQVARLVRSHLLGQAQAPEAAAWRLHA